MAVHKAIRSKSPLQPNPHLKAELFDDMRQLNRGYGVALAALTRLAGAKRFGIFPANFLRAHRNRTEALRAAVNHDLLRYLAGREQNEAARFDRLSRPKQPSSRRG
jgi:hypothetical protein